MLTLFPKRLPIQIHPFFIILAMMIGWLNSGTIVGTAIWAVVVFFSVLFHEFGHAVMGIIFNQNPKITLFGMGGMTERRSPTRLKPWKEFLIVLFGPLFGFLLAFVALALFPLAPKHSLMSYALNITYLVNIFWTILNLFPIHPMDGGKLLLILLEHLFGFKGVKISLVISFSLALIFGIVFFFLNQILVGSLFLLFAFDSWKSMQGSFAITKTDENDEVKKTFRDGVELLAFGKKQFAKDKFLDVKRSTGKGLVHAQATIRLAEIAYANGDYLEALQLLNQLKKFYLDKSALRLKQKALMQLERYKEALAAGQELFIEHQDYEAAIKNAMISAKMKDATATIGWLHWIKAESPQTFEMVINNNDEFKFLENNKEYLKLFDKN